MKRKERQSAVCAWLVMTLLFLSMAVAGTMECRDADEVQKFAEEWQVFQGANGEVLWVRVGGESGRGYRDSMQLVQGVELSKAR